MRVLALSPYPFEGASPRHRVYAFQASLEDVGIKLEVRPFLSSRVFLERVVSGNWRINVLLGIIDGFLSRMILVLIARKRYDLIFIHRQAFPLFQRFLDPLFIRIGLPIVFDMDDAVFTEYPINHLLRASAAVTAGNDYLARYVHQAAPGVPVTVVPTTVNLERYRIRPAPETGISNLVVGWIGTASTFTRYLLPVLPGLVEVTQAHGAQFRVIASQDVQEQAEAIGAVFVPWTLDSEIEQLQQFDIGVMPLQDDEYVRGKCAFKLIQYGAIGIPQLGTDIGANREVIADAESGYLSDSAHEMQRQLAVLLESTALRQKFGQAARKIVEDRFSLQSQAQVLATIFREAVHRHKAFR